jgi:guanyl-specific ribonuclease Sa
MVVSTVVATLGAILCPETAGVSCLIAAGALAGAAGTCVDDCADAEALSLSALIGAVTGAAPKVVPRIAPGSLPAEEEAAVSTTVGLIDSGTTPAGPLGVRWGTKFKNYGGDLPGASGDASPYQEYRVLVSGAQSPGALRVVMNKDTGEMYYTWTHYGDSGPPAFVQIR